MKHIYFGECLERLLSIRGWSAARLALEINIDSSYVRRWIRGERVPSLQSGHVDRIAASISESLDSNMKRNIVNSFIDQIKNMNIFPQAQLITEDLSR